MNAIGKIRIAAEGAARRHGVELLDVELLGEGARKVLRVTLDKESGDTASGDKASGVSLTDCTAVSRDLGAVLDVENVIDGRYVLEVSSAGLDRPLKDKKDYMRNMGKLVKIVTTVKVEGQNSLVGRLTAADDDYISLELPGGSARIPYADISRARLEIEIK
jgi:ribosome maturation factor RimP